MWNGVVFHTRQPLNNHILYFALVEQADSECQGGKSSQLGSNFGFGKIVAFADRKDILKWESCFQYTIELCSLFFILKVGELAVHI